MQVHVPAEDICVPPVIWVSCTEIHISADQFRGKCKAFLDEKQVEGHHSNFCVRDKAEDYKIIT